MNALKITKPQHIQKTRKKISHIINSINLKSLDMDEICMKSSTNLEQYDIMNQFEKNHLSQYFYNLEKHINAKMVITEKKYTQLGRGLYILVKGKVCYTWTSKQHDVDKKYQLFTLAKLGIFNCCTDPCSNKAQNIQNYSIMIEQPFTIIQCQFQNCLLLEDCVLIKIQQEIREMTKFDQLYQERFDMVENSHIKGQMFVYGNLFTVNTKLHSHFKRQNYKYRNSFKLSTIGIIQSGVIRPLRSQASKLHNKCYQMEKYAVILPGIQYQVVSTEAKVMVIQHNLSLIYLHPLLISTFQSIKTSKSFYVPKKNSNKYFNINKKINSNSMYVRKTVEEVTKNMKKWEINQRKRQLTDLSKKYSNQLIINMEMCKQNLQFTEQKTELLKNKNGYEKKPKVLFDFNKYSAYKSGRLTKTAAAQRKDLCLRKLKQTSKRPRKTFNQNLMSRYGNVSKELYHKFLNTRNAPTLTYTPQPGAQAQLNSEFSDQEQVSKRRHTYNPWDYSRKKEIN